MNKYDHVRREAAKPHGGHTCHWPGCGVAVPPAMWGCRRHWFMLPKYLRDLIWNAYRPGQEIDKSPSAEYVAAARVVQKWIKENYPDIPGLVS